MVSTSFTLAGDVSTFDASAQMQFKIGLAFRYPGVSAADVKLTVRSASILVEVEIVTSDTLAHTVIQDLTSSSASDFSQALGQTVTSLGVPTIQEFIVAPPPPPPPGLAVTDGPSADMLMRDGSALSMPVSVLLAALVSLVVCATAAFCYYRLHSKRTRVTVRIQKEFTGLDLDAELSTWPKASTAKPTRSAPTRATKSTTSLLRAEGDVEWTSSTKDLDIELQMPVSEDGPLELSIR